MKLLIVGLLSALSSAGLAVDTEFTVLTYNVQSRPVLDDARAKVNLPVIGAKLKAFDIVGVQECFNLCNLLLDQTDQPAQYYFDQKKEIWSLANSGLASLGRLPLIEHQQTFYQAKAEIADSVASKGIVLMRYQVGGQVLDVYNTHMQAGDSPEAEIARAKQGDELVNFVTAHSPADHAVIVHGDFNMGPLRVGKVWSDYRPEHYSSAEDMQARTKVFSGMQAALGLTDSSDELFGPVQDHIDRILYRNGRQISLKPLEWVDHDSEFRDAAGAMLSDSLPVSVRFSVSALD